MRYSESILSIYEVFIDLSRKTIEDIPLLPDLACNVVGDNYAPSGVSRLCGLNNPFFVFILDFCLIDDKSVVFRQIVNHPVLKKLPMILETPNELPGYAAEIALLRSMEVR